MLPQMKIAGSTLVSCDGLGSGVVVPWKMRQGDSRTRALMISRLGNAEKRRQPCVRHENSPPSMADHFLSCFFRSRPKCPSLFRYLTIGCKEPRYRLQKTGNSRISSSGRRHNASMRLISTVKSGSSHLFSQRICLRRLATHHRKLLREVAICSASRSRIRFR